MINDHNRYLYKTIIKVYQGSIRILQETKVCANGVSKFGNRGKTKFIVLGLQRSGTTLLGTLLGCHPSVDWLGENVHPDVFLKRLYLNGLATRSPLACVGVKVFSYSLVGNDVRKANIFLRNIVKDGWKVIALERRNVVQQAISLTRAYTSNVWVGNSESGSEDSTNSIDKMELLRSFEFLETHIQNQQTMLKGVPYLKIEYEKDLLGPTDHQETANRLFQYLGLDTVEVIAGTSRQSSDKLYDLTRLGDIAAIIKNSKYSHYLKTHQY